MDPLSTLRAFDAFLAERSLALEAVVIGGAALSLLGVITRATKDCDVLAPPLTEALQQAARDFARAQREHGLELDEDWFNNGPASLVAVLPPSWRDELQLVFQGRALVLRTLGRLDLLRSKLFALLDRGQDLDDCLALAPSAEELAEVLPWLSEQDGNPQWPDHARRVLADLGSRLGHGL
jgi:hypothetical protein